MQYVLLKFYYQKTVTSDASDENDKLKINNQREVEREKFMVGWCNYKNRILCGQGLLRILSNQSITPARHRYSRKLTIIITASMFFTVH